MDTRSPDQSPRVSVVVPYFDIPSEHLRECLASVQAQTMTDWETIIVDDASPGEPAKDGVKGFPEPWFRVVTHSTNRGLGAARNSGFRVARAPIVASLDADDRLHPDFLAKMLAALESEPKAEWAWTDLELFGDSEGAWQFPTPLPDICPAHLDYRGGSSVIRRTLWESVGGFTEDRLLDGLEDVDFWLGALEVGAVPVHVPELLYQWRIRDRSMTFRVASDNHLQLDAIYRRHRAVFTENPPACDLCKRGRRGPLFRARGYFNSSAAALREGKQAKAVRMALRGWTLRPSDSMMAKQLLRSLVPQGLRRSRRSAGSSDRS